MTGNIRNRGISSYYFLLNITAFGLAYADDEQAVGTKEQGRTQGIYLPHRAITKITVIDFGGGEYQRYRG